MFLFQFSFDSRCVSFLMNMVYSIIALKYGKLYGQSDDDQRFSG
jgi:hypothetical protein